ncbi:MAG: hypothetical protein FD163_895 [Hyphomonadaceae bacterium]|nr:MAG: hypothetical protein FD128_518 [Hyphomonadaceae bacterium]KAF0186227.1 MAG: hypothetical protein FD163_895 [Hyphomonadaceae bacterium]
MKSKISPNNIWDKVLALLERQTKFKTWSLSSGWLDTEFELIKVNEFKIELVATEGRPTRTLVPATFAHLAKYWGDYKAGKISRPQLKKISNHATFVLPLFKLIEDGE